MLGGPIGLVVGGAAGAVAGATASAAEIGPAAEHKPEPFERTTEDETVEGGRPAGPTPA